MCLARGPRSYLDFGPLSKKVALKCGVTVSFLLTVLLFPCGYYSFSCEPLFCSLWRPLGEVDRSDKDWYLFLIFFITNVFYLTDFTMDINKMFLV